MNRPLLVVLAIGLILAAAGLLVKVVSLLLVIFAGVLFGILLTNLSSWLERISPLPYRGAFAVWAILLAVAVALCIGFAGVRVAQQAADFEQELQQAVGSLFERLEDYGWSRSEIEQKLQDLDVTKIDGWTAGLKAALFNVVAGVGGMLVILFVGLFLAADPHLYSGGLLKLVPRERRERAIQVLEKMRSALTGWIIGRLISMTIIGVATAIGLTIMGVPSAIILGVLAGLLTFIPNLGPIVATLPQALLAMQVSSMTVVYVIVFNIVLQTVESYVIDPIVQRYEASLPPALTISVQLLLGATLGLVGVLTAAPLTVAVLVLVQSLYVLDRLGDPSPGELAADGS